MNAPAKKIVTLTPAALERARYLISKATEPVLGLRIGVKTKGCSGMSYFVEYAKEQKPMEDIIEEQDVKIFIDPPALMYLLGVTVDYIEDKMGSQFTFNNPNEKGRCGCGESFHL